MKISILACDFIPIKIHFSDQLKNLISRINGVYVFSIKYRYSEIEHSVILLTCIKQ